MKHRRTITHFVSERAVELRSHYLTNYRRMS